MRAFLIYTLLVISALIVGSALSSVAYFVADKNKQIEEIRSRTSPVVKDMKIVEGIKRNGVLLIRVVGKKVRDCGPPLSMIVLYGDSNEKKAVLTFVDDIRAEGTLAPDAKGVGEFDFGWWIIDPYPDSKKLTISSVHNCDGVLVQTINGVWVESEYIKEREKPNGN